MHLCRILTTISLFGTTLNFLPTLLKALLFTQSYLCFLLLISILMMPRLFHQYIPGLHWTLWLLEMRQAHPRFWHRSRGEANLYHVHEHMCHMYLHGTSLVAADIKSCCDFSNYIETMNRLLQSPCYNRSQKKKKFRLNKNSYLQTDFILPDILIHHTGI